MRDKTTDYDLDSAYEIRGPEDAARHYDAWSETYDEHFGQGWGYVAPARIAGIFAGRAGRDVGPVLDMGAGTGLVAEALRAAARFDVDAIDISKGMLEKASAKGIYRELIEADLTKPLALPDARYGGVVSCGTFTHGHVGPEVFPELLRIVRPGALFCLGTIAPVLDGAGVGSALAKLVAQGKITPVAFEEIAIYEGADHPHKDDRGLVMVFEAL